MRDVTAREHMSMFFSILIPAYNCERYIDDCINSIMKQSCNDFEVIIINDGSKDNTATKCNIWVDKYPERIRYISQANSGTYLTRRRLLREAKGDYVCFIDADDYYMGSDVFESLKKLIDETQCDIAFFEATSDVSTMKKMFDYAYTDGEVFEGVRLAEIYRLFVNTKKFQHLWNKVIKRSLVDYETLDEPFDFRMLRDGVYQIVPLLSKADRIVYLDKTCYFYRTDNETSVSHSFKIDFFYSMVALHKRILESSKEWKYKNSDTDDYVKAGCTMDMCISAIKVRELPKDSVISRVEYLKMIGEEPLFRRQYTQKHLDKFRKPIAWALFHKQYWIVNIISSFVGVGKSVIK